MVFSGVSDDAGARAGTMSGGASGGTTLGGMKTRVVSLAGDVVAGLSAFATEAGRGGASRCSFAAGTEPKPASSAAGSGTGAVFLVMGTGTGVSVDSLELGNGTEVVFLVNEVGAGARIDSLETGRGTGAVFLTSGVDATAGVGSLEAGKGVVVVGFVSGIAGVGSDFFATGSGAEAGAGLGVIEGSDPVLREAAAVAASLIESGSNPVIVGALREVGSFSATGEVSSGAGAD